MTGTESVVKALNMVSAALMVDPAAVGGGDHHLLISGDDEGAKEEVGEILRSFGWEQVVDLGGLSAARGMEMYLPVWLAMMNALGTATFNIRIVQ